MTADFTLEGYRALLQAFLEKGYAARSFADAEPQERHLVLRHDLDMSLDAALPIAEIERELGVRSCYFVLLRTEMYNVLSATGERLIGRIDALGHEIGLHLDASLYRGDRESLETAAARECAALENVLGRRIGTISFHRPSPDALGLAGKLAGRRHAYEPRFFRDMGYCSDSRGEWRHGHPLDHPAVQTGRALQLLTHPIWWARPSPASAQDALEAFALDRYRLLRDELARNCESFDAGRAPPALAPTD